MSSGLRTINTCFGLILSGVNSNAWSNKGLYSMMRFGSFEADPDTISLGSQSIIRLASSGPANPPNTTVCVCVCVCVCILWLGQFLVNAKQRSYTSHTSLHILISLHILAPLHILAHPCTSLHTLAHPCTSSHTPTHPYTSFHILTHPCTSLHTLAHPCTSLHILAHPYTSLHTPTHP